MATTFPSGKEGVWGSGSNDCRKTLVQMLPIHAGASVTSGPLPSFQLVLQAMSFSRFAQGPGLHVFARFAGCSLCFQRSPGVVKCGTQVPGFRMRCWAVCREHPLDQVHGGAQYRAVGWSSLSMNQWDALSTLSLNRNTQNKCTC